jgi:hypothetical protein
MCPPRIKRLETQHGTLSRHHDTRSAMRETTIVEDRDYALEVTTPPPHRSFIAQAKETRYLSPERECAEAAATKTTMMGRGATGTGQAFRVVSSVPPT